MKWRTRTEFENICENNVAYLYVIECEDEVEKFFKIGITKFYDLKKRFCSEVTMPYNYKEITVIKSTPLMVYDLETKLHRLCKDLKYKPLKNFGGETECFADISLALDYIKDIISWCSLCEEVEIYKRPVRKQGSLKTICIRLEQIQQQIEENPEKETELLIEFEKIKNSDPQIKEWMDAGMDTRRFRALSYTKELIQQEYARRTILKSNENLIDVYLPFKVGCIYSRDEIVDKLQKFYADLSIDKTIKATDIQEWFNISKSCKQVDGNFVSAYKIISKKDVDK